MSKNSSRMVPVPVRSVSDLVAVAGSMPAKTVVIAGGHREDDLLLVDSARDHGIVQDCLLVGDAGRIRRATEKVGIGVSDKHIFHVDTAEEVAAKTIDLVKRGRADMILKGDISTPILNRAILKLRVKNTMGLVTMLDAAPLADGRPMFITDPECTFGRLIDLIENAADVARAVAGLRKPRVALLSANEKVIPSLQSSVVAHELAQREWRNMTVYGPLSFDLATDMDSVVSKGIPDIPAARDVAGQADVLVCPGIDTANAVYKTIMAMVKYGQASMAGVTVGVQAPYMILSRADPVETKLDSIALCCVYAERTKHRKTARPSARAKRGAPRILTLNPGSTSTKIAVFQGDECLHEQEVSHDSGATVGQDFAGEVEHRVDMVRGFLRKHGVRRLDAVVGRGGFLKRPAGKLSGGTYVVAEVRGGNVRVKRDIVLSVTKHAEMDHASNLGIPMAAEFARRLKVPAFAVDPVVVDEFGPEAEISGYAPIVRRSTSHALGIRAAVRRFAAENARLPEGVNLVVAHLGGGATVAAVRDGRMVDNSIALLGEGPFTPQRTGTLPLKEIIDLCYACCADGTPKEELVARLTKKGGLVSYLGDHRVEKLQELAVGGDKRVALVLDAMAYQIAKEIGAMAVVVGQRLESIVLTGGLVRSRLVLRAIRARVSSLGPVVVYRESLEMSAMAQGALRVLQGEEKAKTYRLPR